jgi:hypothetical protein
MSYSKLKHLVIPTALYAITFGSGTMASMPMSMTPPSQAMGQKQGQATFSFVIEADGAKLVRDSGVNYQLTIPIANIKSVLMFSQAPNKIAARITPSNYANMVHSGVSSFDKLAPNMAVTIEGAQATAFKLNGYTKNSQSIIYNLTLLKDQKIPLNQSGRASLFVDGKSMNFDPTSFIVTQVRQ